MASWFRRKPEESSIAIGSDPVIATAFDTQAQPMVAARAGLPIEPTPLVGRGREVRDVCDLLLKPHIRLVTLIGPGGTGKTRVALRVGEQLIDRFPAGTIWVSLASVFDPDVVPAAIAQAIGVHLEASRPMEDTVAAALRGRPCLLILDNFEQVAEAAPLVGSLLARCERLKILLTTRAALRLTVEHEYPVEPLEVPPTAAPAAELEEFESVQLFVERARAVRPDFTLTESTARPVADICRELDGLPLAIELAAARIRILTPGAILSRIDQSFSLLSSTAPDLADRQRTLRATIDWSYRLLTAPERKFFRRLGVFRRGWSLEAVEAVTADAGVSAIDALESLAGQSLVRPVPAGAPRFLLLETIRDFALEQLAAEGELDAARDAHARYYFNLFAEAQQYIHSRDALPWIEIEELELENVRAAAAWFAERARKGDEEALAFGLQLTILRYWHAHLRGFHAELLASIEELLALPSAKHAPLEALGNALISAGMAAYFLGNIELSVKYTREAQVAVAQNPGGQTFADSTEALCLMATGRLDESLAIWYRLRGVFESLDKDAVFADINLAWWFGWNGLFTAATEISAGHFREATPLAEDALRFFEGTGDIHGQAWARYSIATLRLLQGDGEGARALYEHSLRQFEEIGDRPNEAMVMEGLGDAATARGDWADATSWFERALHLYREMGSQRGLGLVLEGLAILAYRRGDGDRALQLAGAALESRKSSGAAIEVFPRQRPLFTDLLRSAADRPDGEALIAQGRSLGADAALKIGLG